MTETSGQQTASSVDVRAGLTFSCNHVTEEDPCPATVLYENAYGGGSDLYGRTRFHHGWHVALERSEQTQEQLLQHSEGYLLEIRELKQTVAELRAEVERRDKVIRQELERHVKRKYEFTDAYFCNGCHRQPDWPCDAYTNLSTVLGSDQAQRGQA